MSTHIQQLSVLFAGLMGAAGFVPAVMAWAKFRGTPFGRALALLPPFMAIIAVYHPLLVVFPAFVSSILLLESVGFALLLLFAIQMIRVHRAMSHRGELTL